MYSHLNAEMVRTNQAELARAVAAAGPRLEIQELRATETRRRRQIRRVAIISATLMLIGGTSDALAATSVHARTFRTFGNSRTFRTFGNSRTFRTFGNSRTFRTFDNSRTFHYGQTSHTRITGRSFLKRA